MKERPILFNAPMVRAILAGTKTQTRRIVKPQPHAAHNPQHAEARAAGWVWMAHDDRPGYSFATGDFRCPYGQPGDRLWVRETWYFEGTDMMRHGRTHSTQDGVVRYLADGARRTINTRWEAVERWMTRKPQNRPGIHMPRWASRITLEVTAVRVERLQDISEADAMSEGAPPSHPSIDRISREYGYPDFPLSWYAQLWDHINGPGSWEANPWVWVVSFKRVTP